MLNNFTESSWYDNMCNIYSLPAACMILMIYMLIGPNAFNTSSYSSWKNYIKYSKSFNWEFYIAIYTMKCYRDFFLQDIEIYYYSINPIIFFFFYVFHSFKAINYVAYMFSSFNWFDLFLKLSCLESLRMIYM